MASHSVKLSLPLLLKRLLLWLGLPAPAFPAPRQAAARQLTAGGGKQRCGGVRECQVCDVAGAIGVMARESAYVRGLFANVVQDLDLVRELVTEQLSKEG